MTTAVDNRTVADVIAAATGRLLTVADWVAVGETDQRFELVEGNLVMAPSPSPRHGRAAQRLGGTLTNQLPAGHEVLVDIDVELRLEPAGGPATVRRPDVFVVTSAEFDRVARDGGLLQAGEVSLVVEILSPGSVRTDRFVKRRDYADAGIAHYWIVELDPRPSLTACRLENGSYTDDGPVTGIFGTREPFAVEIDLDALG